MDRFLPADLAHRPRVRRIAAVPKGLLGDDGCRVHEPGDHPDIGPARRRVVEDVVELRLPGEEIVEHRLARLAEILRHAVEQLCMPDLVLDLGGERELPAQGRRAHEPLALGEDAHQFAVGVHLDEAQDRRPVLIRHPVRGLHFQPGGDMCLEERVPLVMWQLLVEREATPLQRPKDRFEGERICHDPSRCVRTARDVRST